VTGAVAAGRDDDYIIRLTAIISCAGPRYQRGACRRAFRKRRAAAWTSWFNAFFRPENNITAVTPLSRARATGVGMAFASYRGEDRVTLCFLWRCAINRGVPRSANLAGLQFDHLICREQSFPWHLVKRSTPLKNVDRTEGYDIPGRNRRWKELSEVRDKIAEVVVPFVKSLTGFLEARTLSL